MANATSPMQGFGDYLGIPGMVAVSGYLGSKLPAAFRAAAPYVARGAGLASGPLGTALLANDVLTPTPANEGENPYYVRDPKSGAMVLNSAAAQSSKDLLKQAADTIDHGAAAPTAAAPAPAPNSATSIPGQADATGLFGTPPSGSMPNGGSLLSPQLMSQLKGMFAPKPAQANASSPLDTAQWPSGPVGAPGRVPTSFSPTDIPGFKNGPDNPYYSGPGAMPYYDSAGTTSFSPPSANGAGFTGGLSGLW